MRTFNALLMIARAESGHARDDMADFDAAEVARGIAELYEPLAEEKGVDLKVEAPGPITVRGNRELVSQALSNLVDNAIKYAVPDGAEGAIVVTARGRRAGACCSRCADNGPGIPEAERPRVVQRFVRLERSRSQPGSGLGLSLAAAVARLHGGELILADNASRAESGHCLADGRAGTEFGMTPRKSPGQENLGDGRASASLAAQSGRGPQGRMRRKRHARCWNAILARACASSSRFSPVPKLRALIEGIAEGSPYLWDLMRADPARLVRSLDADPDDISRRCSPAASPRSTPRRMKQRPCGSFAA